MSRSLVTQSLALSLALTLLACGGGQAAMVMDEDAPLMVELRGNRIVFNHRVHFDFDSANIQEDSFVILDAVAGVLADHPEIHRVQVQGHSSTDGEEAHNQELSAARAASVAEYLRSHGVSIDVTSQGYGETYPLCHEESDACHIQNRRVEFFVDQER